MEKREGNKMKEKKSMYCKGCSFKCQASDCDHRQGWWTEDRDGDCRQFVLHGFDGVYAEHQKE